MNQFCFLYIENIQNDQCTPIHEQTQYDLDIYDISMIYTQYLDTHRYANIENRQFSDYVERVFFLHTD